MPENIQVISGILYRKGVNIAIAQDGQEALNIATRNPPDLILLDVMMPGMNGFTVCEQLREHPETAHIPIIFLTARIQAEDVIKGFECGAVDYITKPFNPAELLSRVFTHLELKRAHDIITSQNYQLTEQNQALNDANASKDKFFSIIAHDLRNPFNALLSLTDLLKSDLSRYSMDEIEYYINRIHQAAERSYTLLENLLEWSRTQTGKIRYAPQRAYLKLLVDESIRAIEPYAHSKGVTLTTSISGTLMLHADVKMLSTIVRNLVSNAVKFTNSGGTVTIEGENDNEWIRLSVSDTGIGIKPEHVERLFQIDTHHSTLGTAEEKGSGLGLILCKEFIERHGGTVEVQSELGKGSCFIVTLPKYVESDC
jgi:signal transduction histidine kinase